MVGASSNERFVNEYRVAVRLLLVLVHCTVVANLCILDDDVFSCLPSEKHTNSEFVLGSFYNHNRFVFEKLSLVSKNRKVVVYLLVIGYAIRTKGISENRRSCSSSGANSPA